MTNNKMLEALNNQINEELTSAYQYLGMSAYMQKINFKGFASWLFIQAQEETIHAMKIYNFILDRGGNISLKPIAVDKSAWASPLSVFEEVYNLEKETTKKINDLVRLAIEKNDYAAHTFLQWFIMEQVEEEANVSEIIENLKLADSSSLLLLDRELGQRKSPDEETKHSK